MILNALGDGQYLLSSFSPYKTLHTAGPSLITCCLLLVSKRMKETRNYGQTFDSVGFSLHNKVMDDK